jgi:hypothetical protein
MLSVLGSYGFLGCNSSNTVGQTEWLMLEDVVTEGRPYLLRLDGRHNQSESSNKSNASTANWEPVGGVKIPAKPTCGNVTMYCNAFKQSTVIHR